MGGSQECAVCGELFPQTVVMYRMGFQKGREQLGEWKLCADCADKFVAYADRFIELEQDRQRGR